MADFWLGPIIGRRVMTDDLAGGIIQGYASILYPLRPLVRGDGDGGGLAGCHLQLAHPARWTHDVLTRAQLDDGYLDRLHRNCIVWAKVILRGPGSGALKNLDRPQPSKSSWQRWYLLKDPEGD
jgi:hypothetical protein